MSVPVIGMSPETDGKGGPDRRTNFDLGMSEPGIQRFLEERKRSGSGESSRLDYVKAIGSARRIAGKPLLELSKDGMRAVDLRLIERAKSTRTILKMFLRDNERLDLDSVLKRQRRPKKRKESVDEILTPDDVMKLVVVAKSVRDQALLATLYATGARESELIGGRDEDGKCRDALRVGDVKRVNGALQCWFGRAKSAGQERYSPPIEGEFKRLLEEYIEAHPGGSSAFLFPSTANNDRPIDRRTLYGCINGLVRRAGITKKHNPHWFRHSRISVAFANREADIATICVWFWGVPVTPMANLYSHFAGLNLKIGEAMPVDLKPVPLMPVPPMVATQRQVGALTDELRELRMRYTAMERSVQVLASKLALEKGIPPGTEVTVKIPATGRPVSEVSIEDTAADHEGG